SSADSVLLPADRFIPSAALKLAVGPVVVEAAVVPVGVDVLPAVDLAVRLQRPLLDRVFSGLVAEVAGQPDPILGPAGQRPVDRVTGEGESIAGGEIPDCPGVVHVAQIRLESAGAVRLLVGEHSLVVRAGEG